MNRKRSPGPLSVCVVVAVSAVGCSETPPSHCANWWYYWQTPDEVVDDMARVKYLWGSTSPVGVSSPHKTQNLVGLSDAALAAKTATVTVRHKYDPTVPSVDIIVPRSGGIYGVADIIAHEFRHIWVYQLGNAPVGQTGLINGQQHTDGDAIPDDVENDRTPGGIWNTYKFRPDDGDTFDIDGVGWQNNYHGYLIYGDNELLCRVEGTQNPRPVHPNLDWSMGGAQWGQ